MRWGILILLTIGLVFLIGCTSQPEVETVTEPVIEEIVEEVVEEPESSLTEGADCESALDCGEQEPVGEPFCLGTNKYQKFNTPRCTFKEGSNTEFGCKYEQTTQGIGRCDLE